MMISPLTPYVFWIKVAAIAVAAAALVGSGYKLRGWQDASKIAAIELKAANQRAADAQATIEDMQRAGASIKAAADSYAAFQDRLTPKIDQIRKDLKNAMPLPAGCIPDSVRSTAVTGAIRAANASRPQSGEELRPSR